MIGRWDSHEKGSIKSDEHQICSILSEWWQLGGLPRMTREEALKQLKKVIREDPVLLEPLENKLDTIKKRCSSPRKIPQTGRPLWPDMSTEQASRVM